MYSPTSRSSSMDVAGSAQPPPGYTFMDTSRQPSLESPPYVATPPMTIPAMHHQHSQSVEYRQDNLNYESGGTSIVPSTSAGSSRRPLPPTPGISSPNTFITPITEQINQNNRQIAGYFNANNAPARPARMYDPPPFPPPNRAAPPAFTASPELRPADFPRSPASVASGDPPPWAVRIPPPLRPIDETQRITSGSPDNFGDDYELETRVQISSEPGSRVSSKHIDLCVTRGDDKTPASYGKGDTVEGYLEINTFDHIVSLDVTFEGLLTISFSERGMAFDQTTIPLFKMSKCLYTSAYNRPPGPTHPFSFKFPRTCQASDNELPPTWTLAQPGVNAEVTYTLRADMSRSGLRRHDKVSANVEYYPRTAPPPPPISPTTERPKRPRLRVLEISHNLPPMARNPKVPTQFHAQISLTRPLKYPSGSSIPYTVALSSKSSSAIPAALKLSVSLIRTSIVLLNGRKSSRDSTISRGDNFSVDFSLGVGTDGGEEGGTRTIKGSIQGGLEGQESSWKIEGVAQIRYALRFVVTPDSELAVFGQFGANLPSFEHSEEIELTTDISSSLVSEIELSRPARGLALQRKMSALSTIPTNASGGASIMINGSRNSSHDVVGASYGYDSRSPAPSVRSGRGDNRSSYGRPATAGG